jgi:cardiolipin synthase
MAAAAERGANVHVIVPGDNNHPLSQLMSRSYYGRLLDAGVHIYEWPGMTHMKTAASSRGWGADGSYNLDSLSGHHNWEEIVEYRDWRGVNAMLYQLKEDAAKAHEVTRADLPGHGAWLAGKLAHAVMAYFY